MLTHVRPLQPENAHGLIVMTEFGMETLVRLVQSANALSLIEVTGYVVSPYVTIEGMVTSPVYSLVDVPR